MAFWIPSDGMIVCVIRRHGLTEGDYTPNATVRILPGIGNTIYNAFFQRKSIGYQLIQDGFPKVESPTNFEGDSLQDQQGNNLLDPPGVTSDDLDGTIQTETILQEGREGRFIDPLGALNDLVAGKLFVPQHSGIGRLPDDVGAASCSQHVAVDPVTQRALFPIPVGTSGDKAFRLPQQMGRGARNALLADHGIPNSITQVSLTHCPARSRPELSRRSGI